MATKKKTTTAKTKKSGTKKSAAAKAPKRSVAVAKARSEKETAAEAAVSRTSTKETSKPARKDRVAKDVYTKLNGWNWIFAVVYIAAAAAIVIYGKTITRSITTGYVTVDPLVSDSNVLLPAVRVLFNINIAYLVAAVLGLAALKHVLVASVLRKRYESDLRSNTNRSRWLGHGIGDGLAVAGVALISGLSDIATLAAVGAFVFISTVAVLSANRHIGDGHKTGRMVYVSGLIMMLAPWAMIGFTLWSSYRFGTKTPTNYMLMLAGGTFVAYMAYMLIENMRRKSKKYVEDYTNVEWSYMLIGFALKAIFAGVIFNYLLK